MEGFIITENEGLDQVKNLNCDKPSAPDGVSSKILKEIKVEIGDLHSVHYTNGCTTERVKKTVIAGMIIFSVSYIIIEIGLTAPKNLISIVGIVVMVIGAYGFSRYPSEVKWKPVLNGMFLQFVLGIIILRWDIGYQITSWLGDRFIEFLGHSNNGAIFVFGEAYEKHPFAMKVLPVIIFVSSMTSILYYLGVMQFILRHIATFLSISLGTSPTESLSAAASIFLGPTEAPLLIKPYIESLTMSELFAVCTGGFATIAGGVMAAYIIFGVPANHLLAASVMSAPAALAVSKLFWPETEKSRTRRKDVFNMEKRCERNIIEAAANGALDTIYIIASIMVNLIAFLSILELVNLTLKWFGERNGLEPPYIDDTLTFQFICSYVFYPLAFVLGVDPIDCRRVAELIGIKIFVNEFIAYQSLSVYIDNRKNLTWYENVFNSTLNSTWHSNGNDIVYDNLNITLENGILQDKSVVISTYALCGFANLSSIGLTLGGLGAIAPSRKGDLTQVVLRAMIAGNIACFMTACISGNYYSYCEKKQ
ncbi:solute carrier family 28 member 3-like [Mytilus californianus]|uniref:solute carrier family 28 member 3-like n=1 Tax=Mytilus californianus TaxID=6549 RepID=UPI0022484F90|nr:solute carrier family 28 member 3-like [Mytilus californianus]